MARGKSREGREYDNVGISVSVPCPRCGGTTRRIPRTRLDRMVNLLWDVKRFRCTNATCRWEGGVRMKPRHYPRRP